MTVGEAGVYQVTARDLEEGGWAVESLDPARLHLLGPSGELPLWAYGQGQDLHLDFYAQPVASVYSEGNIYWLVDKEDLEKVEAWMLPEEGEARFEESPLPATLPEPGSGTYLERLRLEENLLYSPQAEGGDHWFWSMLSAPKKLDFDFNLDSPASGEAVLVIDLWASTEAPADPDHLLHLAINGQLVAEESWDGKGRRRLEARLPADVLIQGDNQLSIEAPGLQEAAAEVVYINWIEVHYPRPFQAMEDRLEFIAPEGQVHLSGFSSTPRAFDISNLAAPAQLSSESGLEPAQGGGWVLNADAGKRYLVLGPLGLRSVERLEGARTSPELRAADLGADYLVLAPEDLMAPLKPLLDHRSSQGLTTLMLPLQAVYDQFGGGLPEPGALRRFLQEVVTDWDPTPRYLLMVGDASYDAHGYISSAEANRLPVFLVSTIFGGETGSDLPYALLDEDVLADLAVGRLPARTAEQVEVYVDKVLAFEDAPRDAPAVLAIADGQEAGFAEDAQGFLDLFPQSVKRDLYSPPAGVEGAQAEIASRFSQGYDLIAYFGHGSVNMWGKDRLFTSEDAAALSGGGGPTVVIQMTCLTGLFTHPEVESLSEALLWAPEGGAVAALAPTSLTLSSDQSLLSIPLARALTGKAEISIGEALLQARREAPLDTQGAQDVLQTFLLLGDPAISLSLVSP